MPLQKLSPDRTALCLCSKLGAGLNFNYAFVDEAGASKTLRKVPAMSADFGLGTRMTGQTTVWSHRAL